MHTCVCVCVCVCVCIGTCRAVWVPGQDLATPHLMGNCGKRILSLHCMLYIRLCTHMLYAGDHMSLCLVLVIGVRMSRNNPGNAQVCLGLQAPIHTWRHVVLSTLVSLLLACSKSVLLTGDDQGTTDMVLSCHQTFLVRMCMGSWHKTISHI